METARLFIVFYLFRWGSTLLSKNRINDQHICIWGQTINGKQCQLRYFLTFELGPDGAVDEEVDGGVDGEGEMVGAGQAQVPGGPH